MLGFILLTVFLAFSLIAGGVPGIVLASVAFTTISVVPPFAVAIRRRNSVVYPPRLNPVEETALTISYWVNKLVFPKNAFLLGVPLVHLSLSAKIKHNKTLADKRILEAVEIAEQIGLKNKVGHTDVNNVLVLAAELMKAGRFKECREVVEDAKRWAEHLTASNTLKLYAQLLLVDAFACWSLGELDECAACAREALHVGGEALDSFLLAERFHSYNFLMLTMLEQAEYEKASEILDKAKACASSVKSNRRETFEYLSQTNSAVIAIWRGDYTEAEQKLKDLFPRIAGSQSGVLTESDRMKGRAAVLLAVLYADCGFFQRSNEYREYVQKMIARPGELMMKVIFLNDIAYSLYLSSEFAAAEQYLSMAKEILGDYIPSEHYLQATLHNNFAEVYLALGKIEEGEVCLEKASRIRAELFKEGHPYILRIRSTQAKLAAMQGKSAEALRLVDDVLRGRQAIYKEVHLEVARARELKAQILKDMGSLDEAASETYMAEEIRKLVKSQISQELIS